MNDLERLEGKVDTVITKLEVDRKLVDGFDDRVARVESLAAKLGDVEKSLAGIAMKLAITKGLTSWIPGAVAGAVAGVVTWVLLSGIAAAH